MKVLKQRRFDQAGLQGDGDTNASGRTVLFAPLSVIAISFFGNNEMSTMLIPSDEKAPGMRERKKAQRRSHILHTAKELFTQHGYAAVVFDDIARHADVSVGTVYNYFPSKPELLFSLFEAEAFDLSLAITRRPGDLSLQDEIVVIFEQAYTAIRHIEPALWRHVVAEMLLAPEAFVERWLVVEDQLSAHIGVAITRACGTDILVQGEQSMSAEDIARTFYAIGKAGFYAYIGISHEDGEAALKTMFAQIRLLASYLFPREK